MEDERTVADNCQAFRQIKLRPRVLVQGNPHYLGQANVVAEIRAVLLAALRSAVLWRQLGGSLWDFLLRRRQMVASIDALLG